jgi:hypothetical protein
VILLSSQVECEELVLELVDVSQQFSWYLHTALEPRQFHYYRDHLVIPRSSGYMIDLVGYGYLF